MIGLAWEYQSVDVEDIISEGRETLDTWIPDDPYNVAISLSIHIGPVGTTARDLFETGIYTKQRYQEQRRIGGEKFRKEENDIKSIVVYKFDWPTIKEGLDDIIRSCERNTWMDTVMELRKHFPWEFD